MITTLYDDPELAELVRALRPDTEPREVIAAIAWHVMTEPGDAVGGVLREQLGRIEALDAALSPLPRAGAQSATLADARGRWEPRAQLTLVRDAAAEAVRVGATLLLPGDPCWPQGLDDLGVHAPVLLWVRGNPEALVRSAAAVSIVGARASTSYGELLAREIAGDLAERGHVVFSGGAYGIDGAAHRATLAVGGETVAFLAGGIDRLYPPGNSPLLHDIIARGAVVSEAPCGTAPTRWRFLSRNRLIGAASAATVVIEAGWRSGSLNTAGHAAALGRPLGAVPGPVTSATSAGCHRLMREYGAVCVTSAAEVRELVGEHGEQPAAEREHPDYVRLRDALAARSPRTTLDIARRAGLSVSRVESLLGMLSLEGDAVRSEAGWTRAPAVIR